MRLHLITLLTFALITLYRSGTATSVHTEIVLNTVQGAKAHPLNAKGKKAVVFLFVAHDCPVSNGYAPEVNRIIKEYSPKKINFYLVYTESDLKTADAQKHLKDFRYTCPALMDSKHKLVKFVGATVTPEAAVVGPDGKLLYRGRIDDLYVDFGKRRYEVQTHDLRNALDAVLNGKPIANRTTKAIGCFITKS
jgi:thiol-disulfide isomerase/thioredoxin